MTLIVICGATSTGKSDLAVELAKELKGHIVNADSMQLYKGMDIGTAKLSMEERQGIKHHLIDVLSVNEEASVAQYQSDARSIIDQLLKQSIPAIVVGGTGLYIKSILDDLNFPDTHPEVREKIAKQAEELGADVMHALLEKLDPAAAAAIPKENVRRVVRALEVIELTGRPYTANLPRVGSTKYPQARQFGLVMERETLQERINLRVERMWEQGLVREVRDLMAEGLLEGRTAQAALGYAQVIKFAQGLMTEEEAKEETKRATRQYARRQETWFSRDERITWIKKAPVAELVERVISSTMSGA
ncbi:MAG: tRNA (adenosine(37)-N6)-dimethylallyltransferase MiaA [Actinobacteria bacterium]|jgi:tRNA dimethylallyltransferase|nr:tRNA (adenosine(37)-N6)-dimethylallyltransferase MiaA [Actinomycetota bacterium]NCU90248.1 tRNA (adenosine(37)-N6)-dimethylallyltransferase MiaA [Actinomycetota bacterium]